MLNVNIIMEQKKVIRKGIFSKLITLEIDSFNGI